MKAGIHPQYFEDAQVTCGCGNTFKVGATKKHISVEICSKCHPFYTGEKRFVDTRGQVEKFRERVKMAQSMPRIKKKKRARSNEVKTKSLRDLLSE